MNESIILSIQVLLPFLLVALGLIVGSYVEKKHYQSIRAREKQNTKVIISNLRDYNGEREILKSHLVSGSVVISVDYFKRLLAGLRNIFGGRVQAYESLVDRARREAILRMRENSPKADMIINLKIETSSISKQTSNGQQRSVGCVEVVAYGTAVYFKS